MCNWPKGVLIRQVVAAANPPEAILKKVTQLLRAAQSVYKDLSGGGPSDAGLTYLARCCQKLQHLTLLGGSSSAASSLLLQDRI
eukprot:g1326.t1